MLDSVSYLEAPAYGLQALHSESSMQKKKSPCEMNLQINGV